MNYISKLNEKLKRINSSFSAIENKGCILLSGETKKYDEIIKAGKISTSNKYLGVLNNIKLIDFKDEIKIPSNTDYSLDNIEVDCLVIGGGVIGCSILRELSKYNLKSLLIEKESDVSMHQSGRNSGLIYTGIDILNNSIKTSYTARGNAMFDKLTNDLEVPFEHKGQIVLIKDSFEKVLYRVFKTHSKYLKAPGIKLLNRKKLLEIEPDIPLWCKKGIYMPSAGVINPFKLTVALAENAIENGALISLDTCAYKMDIEDDVIKTVYTNKGKIYPKIVINASGIHSDEIAEMANDRTFTIHPVKGTLVVLDNNEDEIVKTNISSSPITNINKHRALSYKNIIKTAYSIFSYDKKRNKIISSMRTIEGNVLIGPSKVETPYREDYSVLESTVNYIFDQAKINSPKIKKENIISYYSGTISATYENDFVVRKGIYTKNIMEASGIQIPGLTASPAIAEDIVKWIIEYFNENDVIVKNNKTFNPHHKSVKYLRDYPISLRDKMIKTNPNYGKIICKCEEISLGEIEDCLSSPLPVYTLDAIKRRVRPGMGKCQGAFCSPYVLNIIAKKKRTNIENIRKSNSGSDILLKDRKEDNNV